MSDTPTTPADTWPAALPDPATLVSGLDRTGRDRLRRELDRVDTAERQAAMLTVIRRVVTDATADRPSHAPRPVGVVFVTEKLDGDGRYLDSEGLVVFSDSTTVTVLFGGDLDDLFSAEYGTPDAELVLTVDLRSGMSDADTLTGRRDALSRPWARFGLPAPTL